MTFSCPPSACRALLFVPHLEQRIWGGRHLELLGRSLPPDQVVGESWEISSIPGRSSVVANGAWRGRGFDEILRDYSNEILGDVPSSATSFPLLVKLLDARERLSVQLHPGDAAALAIEGPGEGSVGKNEAWIVLSAEPGAEIIHGLAQGVDPEDLYRQLEKLDGQPLSPELERSLFRWVEVSAGDIVFVPAGTIHAIGAGVVLAEVQQSSDLTYRIYDWGRRDSSGRARDLHIEKARRVRLKEGVPCPYCRLKDLSSESPFEELIACEEFRLERILLHCRQPRTQSTASEDGRGFHILLGSAGVTRFEGSTGDSLDLVRGTMTLLPAALGDYQLRAVTEKSSCIRIEGPPLA